MKKLLFALCITLAGLSAQAQQNNNVIFLCDSVAFKSPNIPGGYHVIGISAKTLTYNLGDTTAIPCFFQFYRMKDGEIQLVGEGQHDNIPRRVTLGQTTYNLHSMLYSGVKEQVYGAAQIFATAQGYTLLPLNQQTYLNAIYP